MRMFVICTPAKQNDEVEEDVMDRASSMHEEKMKAYKDSPRKIHGRRPLGRPGHRWDDNITYLGMYDHRWGMAWIIGFIDQLGTTSNYSATADLHTLQITAANTKSSPAVSWEQLLTVEVLQLPALRFSCLSCPCRTLCQLTALLSFLC
jgi:hypothetical protein